MKQKILLFDVDGTLVKLDGAGLKALSKTFFELYGIKEEAVYSVDFYGKTDLVIYDDIIRNSEMDFAPDKNELEKIYKVYLNHLKYEIEQITFNPVIPGVIEFLEHTKKFYCGLLTGNIEPGAYTKIGRWNLMKYFSFGAFATDSKIRNELVDVAVKKAAKKFDFKEFDKNEIYVIGDTPLDIKCAQVNSVKSVAVSTNKHTLDELCEYNPDYCVSNLMELKDIFAQ
jgi:phosphoglycolate phosphatase-like HAD superfamily hydrolase